jgi:hypothetical protein
MTWRSALGTFVILATLGVGVLGSAATVRLAFADTSPGSTTPGSPDPQPTAIATPKKPVRPSCGNKALQCVIQFGIMLFRRG